jgi:hypothetical protein
MLAVRTPRRGAPPDREGGTGATLAHAHDGRHLHELIEVRLSRADQRYTPGRRAMVELLIPRPPGQHL